MATAVSSNSVQRTRKRVAFIVGNNEYYSLPKLSQCEKDAKLIQQTLQNIGFETHLYKNLTTNELKEELYLFADNIVDDEDLVFFYFAGHGDEQTQQGWQKQDQYLFGIDAKQDEEGCIQGLALIKKVVRKIFEMRFANNCLIIVLDSARVYPQGNETIDTYTGTNIYESIMTKEICQPSANSILLLDMVPADINLTYNQVDFVYACQSGWSPLEDTQREYGFLARALHDCLNKPGSWRDAIQEAQAQVIKESNGIQRPSSEMNIGQRLEIVKTNTTGTENTNIDTQQNRNTDTVENMKFDVSENTNMDTTETSDFLRKKILQGALENENFELEEEEDDILVNLKRSLDEVTVKGLTLKQKNSDGCRYLVIRLRPQQKINFIDCNFFGIGLRVETTSQIQPSGNVVVKNFNLKSEFGLDFENIGSVSVEEAVVQGCVKSGFRLKNINQIIMKNIRISECSVGIDGNDVGTMDFENFFVEKCVFGFGFYHCDGKVANEEFSECDVEFFKVACKILRNPPAE
eukprot:TRINITY_DN35170_c0_g1_i1.p1 TRINITY_DN35170_c0_g1~~TRINITY_DN35170_c0_g1_i1.p1  ORF type:complete len:535 (-),score=68.05 TRINITY_DN35170_c0_g1_i1:173-1732(-)